MTKEAKSDFIDIGNHLDYTASLAKMLIEKCLDGDWPSQEELEKMTKEHLCCRAMGFTRDYELISDCLKIVQDRIESASAMFEAFLDQELIKDNITVIHGPKNSKNKRQMSG